MLKERKAKKLTSLFAEIFILERSIFGSNSINQTCFASATKTRVALKDPQGATSRLQSVANRC